MLSTSVSLTGLGYFGGKVDVEDREDVASGSLPSCVGPGGGSLLILNNGSVIRREVVGTSIWCRVREKWIQMS